MRSADIGLTVTVEDPGDVGGCTPTGTLKPHCTETGHFEVQNGKKIWADTPPYTPPPYGLRPLGSWPLAARPHPPPTISGSATGP